MALLSIVAATSGSAARTLTNRAASKPSHARAIACNAHLRAAAYRMAVVGITHNPVIRAHYARKRATGKSKMNALGHSMSKALNLIWGVWRNGTDWDPDWALRT